MTDNPGAGALAPYLQLVNSRCPEGISCRQHDGLALRLVIRSQLADGRGLAHPIYADNQQDSRAFRCHSCLIRAICQKLGNPRLQERLQILRRIDFLLLDALAHRLHQAFRGIHAHIRHNQDFLQLIQKLIINIRIADNQLFNLIGNSLPGLGQAFFQLIKKSHL